MTQTTRDAPNAATLLVFFALAGGGCYDDRRIGTAFAPDAAGPAADAGPGTGGGGGSIPGPSAGAGGHTAGAGGQPGASGDGGANPPRSDGAADVLTVSFSCETPRPGPNPLRRLTREEYVRVVQDVFGARAEDLPAGSTDEADFPFQADSTATVDERLLQEIADVADAAAGQAARDLTRLLPCRPEVAGERSCGQQVVATFGRKLFRRTLPDDELAFWTTAFENARATLGFAAAVPATLSAMLQAPRTLYRLEIAPGKRVAPDVVAPDAWETASRLSFLYLGSAPDGELAAAAEANRLSTPAEIAAQARRLVDSPRASAALRRFHGAWLGLDHLRRDFVRGDLTAPVARSMHEEAMRIVEHVATGDGKLATLLTTPTTFLDGPLAQFYGVAGVQGATFTRTALDPRRRAGLLTTGAAIVAHSDGIYPAMRGGFLINRLLCAELGPDPAVNVTIPPVTPTTTSRQYTEALTAPAQCQTCHVRFNGLGYAFGHYDQVGRWRDTEKGQPIDASGMAEAGIGRFADAVELAGRLADNATVAGCYARHWFRYAQGRPQAESDACSVARLTAAFEASGRRIPDLLVALSQTDAFLYKPLDPLGPTAPALQAPPTLTVAPQASPQARTRAQRLWTIELVARTIPPIRARLADRNARVMDAHLSALRELEKRLAAVMP